MNFVSVINKTCQKLGEYSFCWEKKLQMAPGLSYLQRDVARGQICTHRAALIEISFINNSKLLSCVIGIACRKSKIRSQGRNRGRERICNTVFARRVSILKLAYVSSSKIL